MKKSLTIRIPEPCNEGWDKMTPTEKGRFCKVCTKEVIDLTQKSDEELFNLLSNSKNTCGRVKKSQLNREVKIERKSGVNLAPYAASLLIPFTLFSTVEARPENNTSPQKAYSSLGIGRFSKANRIQIITTGQITDENGKPLANVSITVKETGESEVSGMRGHYRVRSLDNETLVFTKDGFLLKEVVMGLKSTELNIKLTTEVLQTMILGEIATPETNTEITVCSVSENEKEETELTLQGKIAAQQENLIQKDSLHVTVSGMVTDNTGLPLPGVNIIVKGTKTGTISDFDGNYKINAMANQQLVFSYLGFETKEVTVANVSNRIDIQLGEGDYLGGLVVVGYIMEETEHPSNSPFVDTNFREDPEREAMREKEKLAYKNQIEYKRIKQVRKKAKRKLQKKK